MDCPAQATITPYTTIRRERRLLVRGEVLVGLGDRIEPADIIARATHYNQVYLLDVARGLGVPRAKVEECLRKEVGEPVRAGEVIASRKGRISFLSRSCRSPREGLIVASRRGRLVVQAGPVSIDLMAGLRGKIARLIPDFGAVIETEGGLIQGVWGLGGVASGIIKVMVESPDQPLVAEKIDASSEGYILVGGWIDRAALEKAAAMKAKAIIVGGAHADLSDGTVKAGFPLVVTEGLGAIPMSDIVFEMLQANDGQEAYVSGAAIGTGDRPEVILYSPGPNEPATALGSSATGLAVGAVVRMIREPHLGRLGVVRNLPVVSYLMHPGSALPGAEVELSGGEMVSVLVRNMELVW